MSNQLSLRCTHCNKENAVTSVTGSSSDINHNTSTLLNFLFQKFVDQQQLQFKTLVMALFGNEAANVLQSIEVEEPKQTNKPSLSDDSLSDKSKVMIDNISTKSCSPAQLHTGFRRRKEHEKPDLENVKENDISNCCTTRYGRVVKKPQRFGRQVSYE